MPIGMAQVAGINFTVEVGDHVNKGDELGTFLFGGSDFILVFQKKADFHLMAHLNRQSYMGELYGWAGPPPDDHPACAQNTEEPQTIEDCPEPYSQSEALEFDFEAFTELGDFANRRRRRRSMEHTCPPLPQCEAESGDSEYSAYKAASVLET